MNEYQLLLESRTRQHLAERKAQQKLAEQKFAVKQGVSNTDHKGTVLTLITAFQSGRI